MAQAAAAQVEADAVAYDRDVRERREREAEEAATILEAQFTERVSNGGDGRDEGDSGELPGPPVGTWVEKHTRNLQTLRPSGATIMNGLTTIKVQELAEYMEKFLCGDPWRKLKESFLVDSLIAIAERCRGVEEAQKVYSFISMLNYINFAFKTESYVFILPDVLNNSPYYNIDSIRKSKKYWSAVQVLEEEFKGMQGFKTRTLTRWLAAGAKMAMLAGAGERIFILFLYVFK